MKKKTFCAFSCVHRPIHDEAACRALIDLVADRRPEVLVCLGDLFDASCISTHENADSPALADEFRSADEFLGELREAAGRRAKLVWTLGNHEERIERGPQSKLREVLDPRRHMAEAKRWQIFPYRQHPDAVYRLGQVSFYHGFAISRAALKGESIRLGLAHGLTVSGHTHRPFDVRQITFGASDQGLPYWHANPGTLIDPAVPYMLTKNTSLWGAGAVCGWADPEVSYGSRRHWDARLELFSMAWA